MANYYWIEKVTGEGTKEDPITTTYWNGSMFTVTVTATKTWKSRKAAKKNMARVIRLRGTEGVRLAS